MHLYVCEATALTSVLRHIATASHDNYGRYCCVGLEVRLLKSLISEGS